MRTSSNAIKAALLVVFCLCSGSAFAEDPVTKSIVFLSASYGYIDYDNDRDLKDRDMGGVALGLHFNRKWSASLFYSRSHPDSELGGSDRFENYYAQGKYYWRSEDSLRPYVVVGLGEMLGAEGKAYSDTVIHTGIGLHWTLQPKWALQLDYRYFKGFGDGFADQTLMSTIVYRFAEGEK